MVVSDPHLVNYLLGWLGPRSIFFTCYHHWTNTELFYPMFRSHLILSLLQMFSLGLGGVRMSHIDRGIELLFPCMGLDNLVHGLVLGLSVCFLHNDHIAYHFT